MSKRTKAKRAAAKSRPKNKPRSSKFTRLPGKQLAPTYEELTRELKKLVPHLEQNGFNNFVLIGYRRVPESERVKYGGAEEAPFYFYYFPQLFPAGAVVEWALTDIQDRLIKAKKENKQQAVGSAEPKKESE